MGNRLAIVEKFGGVQYARTDYQYDALYRLTREERTGPAAYVRTYAYGPTDNRTSQTTSRGGFVEETRLYECDANDRLTTETVTNSGGPREIVYAYDDDGNMLSKHDPAPGAGLIEYTWDSRDRLIGQTGGPDGPVSFLYDSDGNRVEKTVGTGGAAKTTRFLIDAANGTGYTQVRREQVSTGGSPFLETTRYVISDDILAQVRSDLPGAPTLSQYHYDGLGTTRALSGSDGNATDATSYYGFGETLASAGDTPNTLLFTGEQYDPNLGFYHLRARYYDPSSGRFASLDPFVGDPMSSMSLHKYLYAWGDPVARVDPNGLFGIKEVAAVAGIVAILAIHVVPPSIMLRQAALKQHTWLSAKSWSIVLFDRRDSLYPKAPRTLDASRTFEVSSREGLYDAFKSVAERSVSGDIVHVFGHGYGGALAGTGAILAGRRTDGSDLLALRLQDSEPWQFPEGVHFDMWTCHFDEMGRLPQLGRPMPSSPVVTGDSLVDWVQFFDGRSIRGVTAEHRLDTCLISWYLANQADADGIYFRPAGEMGSGSLHPWPRARSMSLYMQK